jgi:uncharacterized protein YdeI (YjbR/CyaY-like superfamily)
MNAKVSLPEVYPSSVAELEHWLEAQPADSPGAWLVLNKKHTGAFYLPYSDLVDVLLCYGWIDSVPNKRDAGTHRLMITPRKSRSVWSAVNRAKIEKLEAEGRLKPLGLRRVQEARADGSWEQLMDSDSLTIPPDLQALLGRHPQAARNFERFSPSSRRNILWYIGSAKRPETRTLRLERTVQLAEHNLRINYPESKGWNAPPDSGVY